MRLSIYNENGRVLTPLLKAVLVVIILVVIYLCVSWVRDAVTLHRVHIQTSWIENFYTVNDRYPTTKEFTTQFPHSPAGLLLGYWPTYYTSSKQAWDFDYRYRLSWLGKNELNPFIVPYGWATSDNFTGTIEYYNVNPCPRWKSLGFKYYPGTGEGRSIPHSSSGGYIFTDLDKGTVYWGPSTRKESKNTKILLEGLDKPRVYISQGGVVKITNGDKVFVYTWNDVNQTLTLYGEAGEVPKRCPE